MQSKFRCQTLATKIGIGRRTLHKIFRVFNFHRKGHQRKFLTVKILQSTLYSYCRALPVILVSIKFGELALTWY